MARVLHLGKFYPPFAGGIENFMADLLPALHTQGDSATALVHGHQAPGWQWGLRAKPDPDYPYLYRAPCYGRLLYAPLSPQFPFWLNQLIQQIRPQLLHLHLPNTSAFWVLTSPAARRLPWVIHWHADVVASQLDWRLALAYSLYRPFEQALLRRSQAIIATSPPYLAHSPALAPWRDKTQVIPLGLNLQRLPVPDAASLAWAAAQWGDTPLRILNVGRLTYYKGQTQLLSALAQVPQARLLIVGSGELQSRLAAQIQHQALGARASLLGHCSDQQLAALLASCEVFCLPSLERTEAFGMVLLEAMAQAKPLLVTEIPGSGVAWVGQAQVNALQVPVGDVPALAQALQQLQQDPALRTRLGRAGQARLQRDFAIDAIAAQVSALYRAVISG